jgi:histidyl-tRNA synthetase
MKKTYASIRGTRDFNPVETHFLNTVVNKARCICSLYGYEEIVLPVLEEEGLFRKGVGETTDIVERQMFRIESRSQNQEREAVVLRPEGTAQVIRYFLQNSLYKQSDFHKFSYFGSMFRGERPQKGRLRQFNHIGVEAIGSNSVHLDVEMIDLAMTLLDQIGVEEKTLKINTLGSNEDKKKFSKMLSEKLERSKSKLCSDCKRRVSKNPLRVIDCKQPECKEVVKSLKIGQSHLSSEAKEHFTQVRSLLDKHNIPYVYEPTLVRGLDYYTDTVFEITSASLGSKDAIGAGGRYNNLIESLGGPDMPAMGFALGIERILLILKDPKEKEPIEVFVVTTTDDLIEEAAVIVHSLRDNGISCDMDYCGKSLKAQMRLAQRKSAKFVVMLGEDEWKNNQVIVKDMESSTQESIDECELVTRLKKNNK